jgi:hypothetical protein
MHTFRFEMSLRASKLVLFVESSVKPSMHYSSESFHLCMYVCFFIFFSFHRVYFNPINVSVTQHNCSHTSSLVLAQCVGCRALLKQPLHLCVNCHASGAHVTLAPLANLTTSSAHFTPLAALSSSRLPPTAAESSSSPPSSVLSNAHPLSSPLLACRCRDELCPRCGLCTGCRCGCHLDFELRYRFMPPEAMAELARDAF